MEPMSDTAPGAKNLKLDRHGPKGKPDTITLLKEQSSKTTPNHILLYLQITAAYHLVSFGEASSCSGWKLAQTPTIDNVQRVGDLGIFSLK